MAEPSTVARPYAEAVFSLADAVGKLAEWSVVLADLAAVAAEQKKDNSLYELRLEHPSCWLRTN